MDRLTLCYFAMVIQVWARPILGNTSNHGRNPRSLTTCNLSSLVIDRFYGRQGMTVAGLYCDYLDRKEQTISNILGAMLKQLVGRGSIPEEIQKAFEDAKDHFGGVRLQVPQLVNMLKGVITRRERVVICIDGLDESLPEHRSGLLNSLKSIAEGLSNVRLFLTGRPFVRSEVEKYFPGVDTTSVSPTRKDTEALLRMKLAEDVGSDAMDGQLKEDIMRIIPQKMSEMYVEMPNPLILSRN